MSKTAVFLFCCGLVLAQQHQEPPKYKLRIKFKEGQSVRYRLDISSKIKFQQPQQFMPIKGVTVMTGLKIRFVAGKADEKGFRLLTPTVEDAEFDMKIESDDPRMAPPPKPAKEGMLEMVKETFAKMRLRVGPRHMDLPLPMGNTGSLVVPLVFPKKTVQVGEKWEDENQVTVSGHKVKTVFSYKLAKVEDKKATIEVRLKRLKIETDKNAPANQQRPMPPQIEEVGGKGKVVLNLETGQITSADYKMVLLLLANFFGPGGKGRMKAVLKAKTVRLSQKQPTPKKPDNPQKEEPKRPKAEPDKKPAEKKPHSPKPDKPEEGEF